MGLKVSLNVNVCDSVVDSKVSVCVVGYKDGMQLFPAPL